ncbi:MAG: hypothetical protein PUC37_01375 [Spirochaetales bacterium]|nr:hypothetical protein [Spirochaetales bacterium]
MLSILLQNIFAHDEPPADILIKLNDEQIVKINIPKAYDVSVPVNVDLCSTLKSLDTKIKQAKEIPLGKAEKSCIDEGNYTIEYLLDGKKYHVQNDYWIYESVSKKFYRCHILNELRTLKEIHEYSDYYDEYFTKKALPVNDCENLDFIKWLFKYESGIEVSDKNIELIKTNYLSGVPVQITQLPYYYKIPITKAEYKQFKKKLKKNDSWEIYKNGEVSLRLITKFCLSCVIKENELIFGFGNIDIIQP